MAAATVRLTGKDLRRLRGGEPLNSVFKITPAQISAIAVIGSEAYLQGRVLEAGKIFKGLVALDDKVHYGHAGLGVIALGEQRLDDAVVHLSKAHDLKPDDAAICANLGEALLRTGKIQQAADMLEEAMTLDPERKSPAANRARAILQGIGQVIGEFEKQ